MHPQPAPQLRRREEFPGWERAPAFLERYIAAEGLRRVLDVGGGANPLLDEARVRRHGLDYHVLDISPAELAKAPAWCRTHVVDVAAPGGIVEPALRARPFDLAFSHMLMEHVRDPAQAHRNIRSLLRPGGLAVHFFPSAHNLPLLINRLVPEALSRVLLRIAQPGRDLDGQHVKFPAYYRLGGNPGPRMTRLFAELGYDVVEHVGYIGHDYYSRMPGLRDLERALRGLLHGLHVPMTSFMLLVLRARADA